MKRTITGFTIAAISYVALATVDTTSAIQALIALPGAAGLLIALWEVIMARIEHQHRVEEASADNAFVLSATSHMAEKAFDKHVEFCEKYVAKANEGLALLFREGPTKKALDIARDLYLVRREFVLWETREVSDYLDKFEQALRNIGADEFYLEHVPKGDERSRIVERVFETFRAIVEIKDSPDKPTAEVAVSRIIDNLRDHLGISKLTALRRHYLDEATKRVRK